MPMSGVPTDWCAPPSGASVTPDGVPDDHEPGILVAGIVERIEAARDERVIHGADRDEPLGEQGMRQSGRAEQQEQVHFRNAELEVLAFRREAPILAVEGMRSR
jgi:hypothetical protein